jgi:hypothetical protein
LQYLQRKHDVTFGDKPDFSDVELLKFVDLQGIFNILLIGFGLEWALFLTKTKLNALIARK